jgi:murein tripeptide amidase MpaA
MQLLDGYVLNDYEISPLMEKLDWYFLPVINADGYEFTFTKVRVCHSVERFPQPYVVSRTVCGERIAIPIATVA